MNESDFVRSNLYMTTEEFAKIVVDALDEQNYFKRGTKNHPQDIAYSFTTVGETIGQAMAWAIKKEHDVRIASKTKTGNMVPTDLRKSALPLDDEIAPVVEGSLGYSEYRHKKSYM